MWTDYRLAVMQTPQRGNKYVINIAFILSIDRKKEGEVFCRHQLKVILIFPKLPLWYPQEMLLWCQAYQNELIIMHVQSDGWSLKPQHSPCCTCPSSAVSLHLLIWDDLIQWLTVGMKRWELGNKKRILLCECHPYVLDSHGYLVQFKNLNNAMSFGFSFV